MSDFYQHRPKQRYQLIRINGIVEIIEAHEVSLNDNHHVKFYGQFGEDWKPILVLEHREIKEIRNLAIPINKPLGPNIVERFRKLRGQ